MEQRQSEEEEEENNETRTTTTTTTKKREKEKKHLVGIEKLSSGAHGIEPGENKKQKKNEEPERVSLSQVMAAFSSLCAHIRQVITRRRPLRTSSIHNNNEQRKK